MTSGDARRVLAVIGINADTQRAIIGEIRRCRGRSWCAGALEFADLLAIGVMTAWHTRQERPDAGGGLIRLRVRWAVHEALRKEAYAHGFTKADRDRAKRLLQERHCRCGKSLGSLANAGVRCCVRCKLSLSAESSRRYRERRDAA